MQLIQKNIEFIKALCVKYRVEKLYAFGSIVNGKNSADSDIDLLVRFKTMDLSEYFENYTTFKSKLKERLLKNIDLVEEQTLKNPILIQSVNKKKQLIYG